MGRESHTRHQRSIHAYVAENWLIIGVLVVLAVVLVVFGGRLWRLIQATPVIVPNVVGMSVDNAETALVDVGLTLGEQARVATDRVPNGSIQSQEPLAGSEAEPGASIDVTVAVAPEVITMPDVVGKRREDALRALSELLLQPSDFDIYDTTTENGVVDRQYPVAGQPVTTGMRVGVLVAAGDNPDAISVPAVRGQYYLDATNALRAAGLDAVFFFNNVNRAPQGQVIEQLPQPGTRVEAGTSVGLIVSASPVTPSP